MVTVSHPEFQLMIKKQKQKTPTFLVFKHFYVTLITRDKFFFFRFRDFHSSMMESCFIFTTFFIFPEWKQNIKIIKTFPVPPQSWSSSGMLTYIAPCKCNFQWVLLHFQVSFSRSLVIYSRREHIPREVFFFFFFPFIETSGGSRRTESGIPHYLEFFGTSWAFLCPVSLPPIPQNSKTGIPRQGSWLIFKMH